MGTCVLTLTVTRDELGVVSKTLVATTRDGLEAWSLAEGADERFNDFALHPSGELTLAVERKSAMRDAFELLRVNAQGQVLHRQVLARPTTIPSSDLAPAFLMKGVKNGSVVTPINGKLNGSHITFTGGSTQYTGDVNGNSIEGTAGGAKWTATRGK